LAVIFHEGVKRANFVERIIIYFSIHQYNLFLASMGCAYSGLNPRESSRHQTESVVSDESKNKLATDFDENEIKNLYGENAIRIIITNENEEIPNQVKMSPQEFSYLKVVTMKSLMFRLLEKDHLEKYY
jgi:hypothetical protein